MNKTEIKEEEVKEILFGKEIKKDICDICEEKAITLYWTSYGWICEKCFFEKE